MKQSRTNKRLSFRTYIMNICDRVANNDDDVIEIPLEGMKTATVRAYISQYGAQYDVLFKTKIRDNVLYLTTYKEPEIEIKSITREEFDAMSRGRGEGKAKLNAKEQAAQLTDKGRDFEEYKRIKDKHVADWSEEEQSFVMWIQTNYQPHELHY